MTRIAWSQFWFVVVNALAGGLTVFSGLNPYIVAGHFLLAIALLTTTALAWHRTRTKQPTSSTPSPLLRGLSIGLVGATLAVILVGTLVTGTGPHAGDSAEMPRMQFEWVGVTIAHSALATLALALALILWITLRRKPHAQLARRRTFTYICIVGVQAILGIGQSVLGLPEVLVAFHLLGSALIWVGALRVALDVNPGLLARRPQTSTEQSFAPQTARVD